MAALSADKIRNRRGTNNTRQEVFSVKTSTTVYIGGMAAFTTLGRVVPAANTANYRPGGMIVDFVNESGSAISAITGNTGGTVKVLVEWGSEFEVDVRTAARTLINIGKTVYAITDNEVTDTTAAGTAAVRVAMGMLTEFTNASKTAAYVAFRVYGDTGAI